MKTLIALSLLSANAFAGECCTGSCWTTGCCDYRQRCSPQDYVQTYECVNVKDPRDRIRVIKANGSLTEEKEKATTTSSGI